ncbi:MAG: ribonuclease E activity regulator RraA [Pseudomonadota bacterium]
MRPTTDLYDDHESSVTTCSLQFRDFGGHQQFFGPIRTVRCHHDNVLFRELLKTPGDGGVIVVDGGGSTVVALMGDMLAARGAENGWAGIIINGAVRDVADLGKVAIGIKALGSNPAKSLKTGAGDVDVTVEFGGAQFAPGQWVYCDENGVLIANEELT